ncbi:GLPGLI family protein [Elizabethkingia meningoseptica]|uniref:GLPGLI family protein n=1 Tax=Elizabethkingia meningoseptica TaxID=238 RepID=UPI0008412EF1|nr:GLPGLI family protein [Elizabethkingia meningoseptica]MDE5467284.1 GLPGLI family protein [Elizabethkingia meningoseptica]MDE5473486.1 GLPGLI family protein [Elizabethkingia meningoseptica]MDE5476919.1 GLPGLI family protein [Elizabethkingia meningoseptica]MDE5484603.1 GLPGLI family protein [Elizabethkingia meningoseptica]MDE5500319.1 GLPGLI family protein [Elizabethkingia meningoseptica]
MNKLLLYIFILCVAFNTKAQTQRFTYEYKFAVDSTRRDSLNSELMILDISKSGSKYYSKAKHDSDSIIMAEVDKQMKMGSGNLQIKSAAYKGSISYSVEKSYPDYKTYLLTNVGSIGGNSKYRVLDDRKMEWKILPDKQKIGEFNTQKAETSFAGRKWIAWFTTEIPFQDGPYKLQGLPGLIVKAESADKTHVMELKGVKKMADLPAAESSSLDLPIIKSKPLDITQPQYAKLVEQYKKDPGQTMRELLNRPGIKMKFNMNGKEVTDPNDMIRQIEKTAKEKLKKENNLIELKLQ